MIDLNRRVRQSMAEAMAGASSRLEAERAGFAGFFRFTAEHPALYRVVREAEFVSPETLRLHYTRIVEGYESGLRAAQAVGDVDPALDPGSPRGRSWAWASSSACGSCCGSGMPTASRPRSCRPAIFDDMMRFIDNALAPRAGGRRMTDQDLAGRRAVVTGGASGIGLACAREFAARGAHVVIADLDGAAAEAAATELGGEAWVVDLADTDGARRPDARRRHPRQQRRHPAGEPDPGVRSRGVPPDPAAHGRVAVPAHPRGAARRCTSGAGAAS